MKEPVVAVMDFNGWIDWAQENCLPSRFPDVFLMNQRDLLAEKRVKLQQELEKASADVCQLKAFAGDLRDLLFER